MTNQHLRRNLSGIFLREALPHDGGVAKTTCIIDCTEEKRLRFLNSLDSDGLIRTAEHLNETFSRLWEHLSPSEQEYIKDGALGKPYCDITPDRDAQIKRINRFCKLTRSIADYYGICAPDSEAAEA